MKRGLLLLVVLALVLLPASIQARHGFRVIKYRVSGTATILGDPFAGPFTFLPILTGSGNLGGILGQGVYKYETLNPAGGLTYCELGQFAFRLDSKGETLLAVVTPDQQTGTLTLTGPNSYSWTQTWRGTIVGGTGRFAGATGTFTKSLTGFLVAPGFVSPWQGRIEILLDRD